MIFLIDHNLNGHAMIFFGSIASKAARCLKHLCRLLPEARDVLLKNNASEIILQAQRIGLAIHARLENECSELLQVLYH